MHYRLAVLLALISLAVSSCDPVCTIPTEATASIRVLNSMIDYRTVSVFIDGQLLEADAQYDPPQNFGYRSVMANGSIVSAGRKHVIITGTSAGRDTLVDTTLTLTTSRQTLHVFGRGYNLDPTCPRTAAVLLLSDGEDPTAGAILDRFVNVSEDLQALDFSFEPGDTVPRFTLTRGSSFGHTDLSGIPNTSTLFVRPAGDRNTVVFTMPALAFKVPNTKTSLVIRGSGMPKGTEPAVGAIALVDGGAGIFMFSTTTFGVRLVNGRTDNLLHLLVQGPSDQSLRTDIQGQRAVENVPARTVSAYAPFTMAFHRDARWAFGTAPAIIGQLSDTVNLHSFRYVVPQNLRYTMIAIDKDDDPVREDLTELVLMDTMTFPQGNVGRVRFVNASYDNGSLSFEIPGVAPFTLGPTDVKIIDLPASVQTVSVKSAGGSEIGTLSVTPLRCQPISVFILPAKSGDPLPYAVAKN